MSYSAIFDCTNMISYPGSGGKAGRPEQVLFRREAGAVGGGGRAGGGGGGAAGAAPHHRVGQRLLQCVTLSKSDASSLCIFDRYIRGTVYSVDAKRRVREHSCSQEHGTLAFWSDLALASREPMIVMLTRIWRYVQARWPRRRGSRPRQAASRRRRLQTCSQAAVPQPRPR